MVFGNIFKSWSNKIIKQVGDHTKKFIYLDNIKRWSCKKVTSFIENNWKVSRLFVKGSVKILILNV